MMNLFNFRILLTAAFLALLSFGTLACLNDPPASPPHDNPWDPENPEIPRAPSSFRARALSETTVLLTWADQSGNEDGFNIFEKYYYCPDSIELGAHLVTTLPTDIDSLFLANRPQAFYRIDYTIESFNQAGPSNFRPIAITSTCEAPPLPPVNLTGELSQGTLITLNWTDQSLIEERFEIEISLNNPLGYFLHSSVPADSVLGSRDWNETITIQQPDVRHFVRVRAVNRYGSSQYSPEVIVTPVG